MKSQMAWFRILRALLFLGVTLITLVWLASAWFSYQGRKELAASFEELRTRGEPLTFEELLPPAVAPEDNFFADPIWEELTETQSQPAADGVANPRPVLTREARQLAGLGPSMTPEQQADLKARFPQFGQIDLERTNQDALHSVLDFKDEPMPPETATFVMALLVPSRPMLERFRKLGERSGASFTADYQKEFSTAVEHVHYILTAAKLLSWRAQASLVLGRTDEAFSDVRLIFRLADTLAAEPLFISQQARIAVVFRAMHVLPHGIPVWKDAHLSDLDALLGKINLTDGLLLAFRGERAWFNHFVDQLRQNHKGLSGILTERGGKPTGTFAVDPIVNHFGVFVESDRAFYNRHIQKWIDGLESKWPLVDPTVFVDLDVALVKATRSPTGYFQHILTNMAIMEFSAQTETFAYAQNEIGQARIAAAIQRYFLRENRLPEKLEALIPRYLGSVPIDLITGEAQNYRVVDHSNYLLWSVGWNLTDEDGLPPSKDGDRFGNDWVWSGSVEPLGASD